MNVLQHTRNERNPCLKQNRPDRSYRDTLLILVENIQRRATRFILRNSNLCCKARLIKLKLLLLSYWLEYLDLVFFFKCLHGLIDFTREFSYYISFLEGNTCRASSGLHLKLNAYRTSSFRDFFFNRITLI